MSTYTYRNGCGSRGRRQLCMVVANDGTPSMAELSPVHGVTNVRIVDSDQKRGRWSYDVVELTLESGAIAFDWQEDYESGAAFPQASLSDAIAWVKSYAPHINVEKFKALMQERFAYNWEYFQGVESRKRQDAESAILSSTFRIGQVVKFKDRGCNLIGEVEKHLDDKTLEVYCQNTREYLAIPAHRATKI